MTASYKSMNHKLAVSLIVCIVALSGVIYIVLLPNTSLNKLVVAQTPKPVREIKIQPDGSILDSNPITPLKRSGDVYTFSGDINGYIDIQKSGITLDGAGYTLGETGQSGFGIWAATDGHSKPIVNNITIKNIQIIGYSCAIMLEGSDNTVTNINITGCTASGTEVITVGGSHNTLQGCHIVGNSGTGILVKGDNMLILDNVITNNTYYGISFYNNPIKLRSNILNNNDLGPFHMYEYNVDASGQPAKIKSDYIDSTNLVEGKPVYYWVNERDKTVPSNAGYVVLDSCKNIVVENVQKVGTL